MQIQRLHTFSSLRNFGLSYAKPWIIFSSLFFLLTKTKQGVTTAVMLVCMCHGCLSPQKANNFMDVPIRAPRANHRCECGSASLQTTAQQVYTFRAQSVRPFDLPDRPNAFSSILLSPWRLELCQAYIARGSYYSCQVYRSVLLYRVHLCNKHLYILLQLFPRNPGESSLCWLYMNTKHTDFIKHLNVFPMEFT